MNKKASGFGFGVIVLGIIVLVFSLGFIDVKEGTHLIPGEQAYGLGLSESQAESLSSSAKSHLVIGILIIVFGITDLIINRKS